MKIFQIVFASVLGAVIGTILALQFGVLWFAGAFIGAVAAWVMYDPASFYQKSVNAFKDMLPKKQKKRRVFSRAERTFLFWRVPVVFCLAGAASALFNLLLFSIAFFDQETSYSSVLVMGGMVAASLHLCVFLICVQGALWPGVEGYRDLRKAQKDGYFADEITESQKLLLKWNFFTIVPLTLWYLGKALFGKLLVFIWRKFLKLYFATVSNGRIVSLLGASTGSVIGYFYHSAIIGGAVGAGVGLALYLLYKQTVKTV